MSASQQRGDVRIESHGRVGLLEICRPPHNFFDEALIRDLADSAYALAKAGEVRALVLAAQGKAFCAGGKFHAEEGRQGTGGPGDVPNLYHHALRLVSQPLPMVAAIQGAATGGGLGVALTADFRIAAPEARFWGNFAALGIYPGFGLTATLPRLVGAQKAAELFLTARRVKGEEALAIGLADRLVAQDSLREAALGMAGEIAAQAPLAITAIRTIQRKSLVAAFSKAVEEEWREQAKLFTTEDHREGVKAVAARRAADFKGK